MRRLTWLGFELDAAANERGEGPITSAGSGRSAFVIPTDEEWVIARETIKLLAA